MRMTKTKLTIYLIEHYTKLYLVDFKRRVSWVKPVATNFGVGLMLDFL